MARGSQPVADGRHGERHHALARWLDVRPGEWGLTALLAFSAFCVICSYYFLKPASKSIFLAAHGARSIPDVYIAVAIATGIVGTAYAHLSRRVRLVPLLNGVLVGLAVLIAAFRIGFDVSVTGWLAWAFYIFVSTFGVLAPAMLWFAVNHMLEPRQARRLLGYIGVGAIVGGIAGGYLAAWVLGRVAEKDLLWGAELFFVLALVSLDLALWRSRTRISERRPVKASTAGTLGLIVGHRYLRMLAGLIALVMVCASLAEFQYMWAVDTYVPDGKETARYLATWYSHLNLLCLPIQLLVTAPLLRRFGVGPALLVLPVALFSISSGMVAAPILALGTAMKVGESALRYSVNKSAIELLYLPLPRWIKDRSKVFVDTVMDRVAKGAAGLLLKGLFALGSSIQIVAAVTAGLALAWIALALVLRRRYVHAFREALDRGTVDLGAERIRVDQPEAMGAIAAGLADPSPVLVRQALDVLITTEDADLRRFEPRLRELALGADTDAASRALELLARDPGPAVAAVAEQRLDDAHPHVAAAAARALLAATREGAATFLARAAQRGEAAESHAAGALLGRGDDLPDELVDRLLNAEGEPAAGARRALAIALTGGGLPHRRDLIRRLMADPEPWVAVPALSGAGALGDPDLVPFLLAEIRRPSRRSAAREGLARMGEAVLPALDAYLWDPRLEHDVRMRIPRVMSTIGGLAAHGMLRRALTIEDPQLRHQTLKALNRLAGAERGLHLPDAVVESELVGECHYLARLLALGAEPGGGGRLRRLYERALQDSVRQARERAFRLLGLRGAGRDWANAFAGLVGDDARLRASAVEFADGTLPERLRRIVVPLIDDIGASEAIHRVGRHLRVDPLERDDAYAAAARGAEPWLAACALFAAAEEGVTQVLPVAQERLNDPDPWVRDAAAAVVEALGGGGPAEPRAEGATAS